MYFLADGMLGRFARWLRLLGHDVEYFKQASDAELLEAALKEHRILLTCDLALYRLAIARGADAFHVEGKTEAEKLANIAKRFQITLEVNTKVSRCPICNSSITPTSKDAIRGKIPKSTLRRYKEFWVCKGCGRYYWRGSHWKKIDEVLTKANMILQSQKP
ncbi:Mut7-C RNAse domain-containing protein [Candidatus Bathyarchaeota archaeon]|nr:Mut7-C RNAse domain-containing protein [Candidatus Bathyarchaeota archaeon]